MSGEPDGALPGCFQLLDFAGGFHSRCPDIGIVGQTWGQGVKSNQSMFVQNIPPLRGISGQRLLDKPSRVQKLILGRIVGRLLDILI
jgi:hypothetical protein